MPDIKLIQNIVAINAGDLFPVLPKLRPNEADVFIDLC